MIVKRSVVSRICIVILAIFIHAVEARAQDPEFSQFYANPVYTNPAFAGSSNVGRVVLNARSQWAKIAGSFRTVSASFDEHYDALNGGIGVMVTADEAGTGLLTTLSLAGVYSYQIVINKYLTMRMSVQGSITQKTIDFGKLTFYDQIELQRGFVHKTQEIAGPTVYYPNFAAGGVIYSNKFYAGIAAHNLIEPNQAFYKETGKDAAAKSIVPMRYTVHAGLVIPIIQTRDEKRASNLWPNVLFMQQRQFSQINLGVYYNQGPLVIGTYFRQTTANTDCMIMLFGVRRGKLRLGYSYDATFSKARQGAPDSHELSLAFELRKHTPRKTIKAIRCPEF